MSSSKKEVGARAQALAKQCGVSISTVYRRMRRIPLEVLEANPSAMARKARSDKGKQHQGKGAGIFAFKPWGTVMSQRAMIDALYETFGTNSSYVTPMYIRAEIDNLPYSAHGKHISDKYGLAGLFIIPLCLEIYGTIPERVPSPFQPYIRRGNLS